MSEHRVIVKRADEQAALTKLLHLLSARIEAEFSQDHSMAALAEAAQALKRIRRLAGLLGDAIAAGEINARADALESSLNALKAEKLPASA